MRVLIADDDPVFQSLLQLLLREWGFEATIVTDGAAAWEALQQSDAPSLLILDWMMPGLDGYEVCRRVRERYGSQRPYILLMTGNSKREEILKVIVAGADDYLLKPFEPLDLQIRLRLAMRVLRLQAEAPSNSPPPAIPSPVGT